MQVVTVNEVNQRLGNQAPVVSLVCSFALALWLIWSWMVAPGPLPILLVSLAGLLLLLFFSLVLEQILEQSVVVFSWIFMSATSVAVKLATSGEVIDVHHWLGMTSVGWFSLVAITLRQWQMEPLAFMQTVSSTTRIGWFVPFILALISSTYVLFSPEFYGVNALYVIIPLLVGALCGQTYRSLGFIKTASESHSYVAGLVESGLKQVDELIADYKLPAARRLLEKLSELAPLNDEVKRASYTVWKYDPKHEFFHATAAELLDRPGNDDETNDEVATLFDDYMAVTQGQPNLPDKMFLRLSRRFSGMSRLVDAALIVNLFLQRDKMHEDLPTSMLALSQAYLLADKPNKAFDYSERLLELFPTSTERSAARRIIRKVRPKG